MNVLDGKASKGTLKLLAEDKLKSKLDIEAYLDATGHIFNSGSKLDIEPDSDVAGNIFNSDSSSPIYDKPSKVLSLASKVFQYASSLGSVGKKVILIL